VNPEGFLADVLDEPATLERVLDAACGLSVPDLRGRRVVLLGMGSSRFAALTAVASLRAQGVAAWAEYASTASPTLPGADVVAVGISATGSSEETVSALGLHKGVSQTIAITNRADAPLGLGADTLIELGAGEEAGGVACKTFQATLALLYLIAGHTVDQLRPAVGLQAALLDDRHNWLPPLLELVREAHTTYALAPAQRLSSALQSALMLREGPRLAADSCETGDWLHVDVYLSKHPGYTALLFTGSRYDDGVLDWARQRGSRIVAIGSEVRDAVLQIPVVAPSPAVASLIEVSIVELLAGTLWAEQQPAAS
jgi:glutamine---fructose-6-phosphate transaminase (isomerizing)